MIGISFGYSIFVFFWTIIISLKYTYDRFRHKKFEGVLRYKLGIRRQKIVRDINKKCIWIHATSYGETMSTKALVQKLKLENKDCHIILSAFTSAGYFLAKTIDGIDEVIILPIDLKWSMRALIKSIKPDLFILIESDYWLNLLNEMKKFGVKIVLIGGRISDRSFKRFSNWPVFAKCLFNNFDYMLLQDTSMESKFIALGVPQSKIEVIGNLKLDTIVSKVAGEKEYFLDDSKRYITFGSTHRGEESLLLTTLNSLSKDISFILAPRRPDRFSEVEKLLNEMNIKWRFVGEKGRGDERVIFVNRLGILNDCYLKSELAIVGGSFVDGAGGHNVFEPVRQGTPVIYGPFTYNQNSLTSFVEKFGVGQSCTEDEILEAVKTALLKGRLSPEVFEKIKDNSVGVTEKAINLINSLLLKT